MFRKAKLFLWDISESSNIKEKNIKKINNLIIEIISSEYHNFLTSLSKTFRNI